MASGHTGDSKAALDEPWRKGIPKEWDNKELVKLMKKVIKRHGTITKLMTPSETKKGLTVFLVGPAGHGKSSTINGICSAIENARVEDAIVRTQQSHSTLEFRRFRPRMPTIDGEGSDEDIVVADELGEELFNINFADFVGIDDGSNENYKTSMKHALFGHLQQGHKAECTDEAAEEVLKQQEAKSCVEETTVESACVVWVVDIRCSQEDLGYMSDIIKDATRYGIPQFLALTKCDNIDERVYKEPRNMYYSSDVEQKVAETAAIVGVPLYRTFPIKNFINELDVEPGQTYQYLYMLQYIMENIEGKLRQLYKMDPNRKEEIQGKSRKYGHEDDVASDSPMGRSTRHRKPIEYSTEPRQPDVTSNVLSGRVNQTTVIDLPDTGSVASNRTVYLQHKVDENKSLALSVARVAPIQSYVVDSKPCEDSKDSSGTEGKREPQGVSQKGVKKSQVTFRHPLKNKLVSTPVLGNEMIEPKDMEETINPTYKRSPFRIVACLLLAMIITVLTLSVYISIPKLQHAFENAYHIFLEYRWVYPDYVV